MTVGKAEPGLPFPALSSALRPLLPRENRRLHGRLYISPLLG